MFYNFSLKPYNTFGIDVYAKFFTVFRSLQELELLFTTHPASTPTLVLGGGSNILFTKNFDGLVLKNECAGINVVKEDEDFVYIKAAAGENWHRFVLYCVHNNFYGVENLSLIPGNIGASPIQNIGAYGAELQDVFYELEAFHLTKKCVVKFNREECEFGYRRSIFKEKYKDQLIILNVTFRLTRKPHFNISYGNIEKELQKMNITELSIQAVSQAVINIRRSKLPDPAVTGNAGSFYKNPEIDQHQLQDLQYREPNLPFYKVNDNTVKIPAGWLIEQCGWKGYRKGDAGCHEKQALVLVNYGNASGAGILDLSEEIKNSVKRKFDVDLETEVNIV